MEKLEQIKRKLDKHGDISFEDADCIIAACKEYFHSEDAARRKYFKEKNPLEQETIEKHLRSLFFDILTKLEKGEEGNFIASIPFPSLFRGISYTRRGSIIPIIKECYKHLCMDDIIRTIFLPEKEMFKESRKFFRYDDLHNQYRIDFDTCGGVHRAGIPIHKTWPVHVSSAFWVYEHYQVLCSKDERMFTNLFHDKKAKLAILRESITAAILKKTDTPIAFISYYPIEEPYPEDLVIPRERREIIPILNIARKELDLVSMWEEKFGSDSAEIRVSEINAFADIVLTESRYINDKRSSRQEDLSLDITR